MSDVWLKVLCPVRVSLLTDLVSVAPKKLFIRDGGSVELDGKIHRVLEFVVPEEDSATNKESLAVQSTSSGGSGGASTYGGNGLGIAGAVWPPETRITVNGKTFCLADIDKEMTE